MDIRRKLGVTLAALVLAGQLGAALPSAAASQAQLQMLQAYLAADDLAGLARYVEANPTLLEPDSPLSGLLADFLVIFRGSARLAAFTPLDVESLKGTLAEAVKAQIY